MLFQAILTVKSTAKIAALGLVGLVSMRIVELLAVYGRLTEITWLLMLQ